MNTQIQAISEAYSTITEAKQVETKFNVGDKVGIGSHGYSGLYAAQDTGVVSAIDKQGNHTVIFDNRKQHDLTGAIKPMESTFNSLGIGKSNSAHISSMKDHNDAVSSASKSVDRTNDLNSVLGHLQAARTQNGTFTAPLQKTQVAHIKALLDKHTEA